MRNYVKTIKMFCEVTDVIIPWKKITQGLPQGKRYADDRAPTIEEICKIIEYPDRRIKANSIHHDLIWNKSWGLGSFNSI